MASNKEKGIKQSRVYVTYDYENNQYNIMEPSGEIEDYSPDTFRDWFVNFVETNRVTTTVWLFALNLITVDIIRTLRVMGYNDVTELAPPIKAWKVGDFDYTVSDNGSAYRMRIKGHGKKTITIYDAVNLLGKDLDAIIRDFSTSPVGNRVFDSVTAVKNGVECLTGKYKRRVPYTISMVAHKVWREIEGYAFNDPCLIDCNGINMPGKERLETLDTFIRQAYRGGFNYLSEMGRTYTGPGVVLDVNSLYPYIMRVKPMPFWSPMYSEDIPDFAKAEDGYYFVRLRCRFSLKDGMLPYIGIRDFLHKWGLPLESSDYELNGKKHYYIAEMTLTKTDWEMMQKVYNIEDLEIIECVSYKTCRSVFSGFVDYYYEQKQDARARGDKAKERCAKMMLNGCAGTLAKIQDRVGLVYKFNDDEEVYTETKETHTQSKSYIHIAAAILSYARAYIYNYALENKERYLYTDTDSIHLAGKEIPENVRVSNKLGDFKVEETFDNACYYKRKMYAHEEAGKVSLTLAGISKEYRDYLQDFLSNLDWGTKHLFGVHGTRSMAFVNAFGNDKALFDYNFTEFEYFFFKNFPNGGGEVLDVLRDITIPNGERICYDFSSRLRPFWVSIE